MCSPVRPGLQASPDGYVYSDSRLISISLQTTNPALLNLLRLVKADARKHESPNIRDTTDQCVMSICLVRHAQQSLPPSRGSYTGLGRGCFLVTNNIRASEWGCYDPKLQREAEPERCWAEERLGWGEAGPGCRRRIGRGETGLRKG